MMSEKCKIEAEALLVAVSICLILFSLSLAHPHIFIDNTVTFVFDKKGLAGIKVQWVFDEMYSSMMVQDFDQNRDTEFDSSEVETIKREAFSNLKEYNYFTYVTIDTEKFEVKYVKDFSASLNEDKVVFSFLIPCHVTAAPSYKEMNISIYDVTYYTDISLPNKNSVFFENASHIDFNYRITEDTDNSYYYEQIFPKVITLKFRKKS